MTATRRTVNRVKAQRPTGPRTAEGKRRSTKNARRHGLCCIEFDTVPARERIEALAGAFLGGDLSGEIGTLAREAARAHYALAVVQAERSRRLRQAEDSKSTYFQPRNADRAVITDALQDIAEGHADFQSPQLREFIIRTRRGPLRGHLRHHLQLYLAHQKQLERLERYEARAEAHRRRAIAKLDRALAHG